MTNERDQQFLYLSTKGWRTGRQHKIEIWFVSYADKYYVVAERKEKAHWVQNIMDNPTAKSFEVLHEQSINMQSINWRGK
jgi:F420H(2)-dependent quinone reductase